MKPDVKKFYNTFDFEKVIANPPKLIQDFIDGEIKFIKLHIKKSRNILEVGCGYGRLLKILSLKATNIVGIDFSSFLLKKAKYNLKNFSNIKLLLINAKNIMLPKNSFDYVVCLDNSFGNMPGIEDKVIKQMKKVCKKNGEIIISVFSKNAKAVQIKNYKRIGLTGIKDDGIAVHTNEGFYSRRFSKKDLNKLFNSIGLKCKIIKICPVNYIAYAKNE